MGGRTGHSLHEGSTTLYLTVIWNPPPRYPLHAATDGTWSEEKLYQEIEIPAHFFCRRCHSYVRLATNAIEVGDSSKPSKRGLVADTVARP